MNSSPTKSWDIFCRVVDNYGDIGVCWRLARQLASEYPIQVRLWVDEIEALRQIWPRVEHVEQQLIEKVEVRIWQPSFEDMKPADVVIEAFACDLPDGYLLAMKTRPTRAHWFNLEYLSAEDWVEGCHGLFSMHPTLGLKKAFFFPGFTLRTGGLLRENILLGERDCFQADPKLRIGLLNELGIQTVNEDLVISLFGYENAALPSLLAAWTRSKRTVLCLVPNGKILPDICNYFNQDLVTGDELSLGSLRIKIIPFLTQTRYDHLLWACDVNFVRGEDSFVRAQWAQKPMIWNIYPQDDDIHLIKLDAFLALYLRSAPHELHAPITNLWRSWNTDKDVSKAWDESIANLKSWQKHSENWCQYLNSLGNLASNMVQFCQKTL